MGIMPESFPRGNSGSGGRGGTNGGGGGGGGEGGGRGDGPRQSQSSSSSSSSNKKRKASSNATNTDPPSSHHNNPSKKRSSNDKNDANDVLFGRPTTTTNPNKQKKIKSSTSAAAVSSLHASSSASTSLLPVGGGGVVHPTKGGESWIEAVSFQKLGKGTKLLGVVREIHPDAIVFALPNLLTGYMLLLQRNNNKDPPGHRLVSVGQYLSVTVVKAVQETTPDGLKRRIQVCCKPSSINPIRDDEDAASKHGKSKPSQVPTTRQVRGQIRSVEDHGVLVDLGHGRRGFLNFDHVEGDCTVDDDEGQNDHPKDHANGGSSHDNDNDNAYFNPKRPKLNVGRILDVILVTKPSDSTAVVATLKLPLTMARHFLTASPPPPLTSLRPGMLVHAAIETTARNGLCVTFASGVYRGAIEVSHLGGCFLPGITDGNGNKDQQHPSSDAPAWKTVMGRPGIVLAARLLVVDAASKIIRLTLLPHLLDLVVPTCLPAVGTVIRGATVARLDPGVGAVLALPLPSDDDMEDGDEAAHQAPLSHRKHPGGKLNTDLWKLEAYRRAAQVQTVYVHISKALDDDDTNASNKGGPKGVVPLRNRSGTTPEHIFAKSLAPFTKHDVRILSAGHWVDGVAAGATAPRVVAAHVLTHDDLVPGQLYSQVTVLSTTPGGAVLIDFGMGVRGLIPPTHLFDQNSATTGSSSSKSDFRTKLKKVMYGAGAKVDVRVLTLNAMERKCVATAKKALVKAPDDSIVTSYESLRVGQVAVGFVSKVDAQGLCVTFFNGVYGRVTSKCLFEELGVDSARENYQVGDAVTCRIVRVQCKTRAGSPRRSRSGSVSRENDNDDMEIDPEDGGREERANRRPFWELMLSLKLTANDDVAVATSQDPFVAPSAQLHIQAGAVLPLRSLRIVQLIDGKTKDAAYTPGYAIVSIKSKYLLGDGQTAHAPEYIECKLPYDQLLDDYSASDIESSYALDALAAKLLQVGKKINRKGLVLTDPGKLAFEYTSGIGRLAVVSVRPQLVETAEAQAAEKAPEIILPGPYSHVYVGAALLGYVAQIDRRHGAFVRYLNGLTGLIPKSKGGLDLTLYSTVTTKVLSVDVNSRPMKISLSLASVPKRQTKHGVLLENSPIKPGDIIKDAEIVSIDFHRIQLKLLDETDVQRYKYRARIHFTLAKSRPLRKPLAKAPKDSTQQVISDLHPFGGMAVGETLHNLRVVTVDARKDTFYVDLTNDDDGTSAEALSVIDEASQLSPGQTVSGIVTSIDTKRGGLFLQISPSVSGFIPGLELSMDPRILNNLPRHFVVGCRLDCVCIDREAWRKTHSRYDHTHNGKEAHIPFFSHLRASEGESGGTAKPTRGQTIIGRINRSLAPCMPPSLMLELRNGYIGRCCITELAEHDDWINMPLGDGTHRHDANDASGSPVISSEKESQDPFHSGRFVQCRVLEPIPSKPLVDVSLRSSRLEGDLDDDEGPEIGELAHAFVIESNKKGCFVRLSRSIEGRIALKELCDGFLSDPPASFPRGRLVVGKVKSISDPKKRTDVSGARKIKKLVDLDLRESVIASADKLQFDDIQIGEKHKGVVGRIEDYGVFVKLHNSDVSGLVHKSECSDDYIKSLSALYDPGDLVKVLVLKKDTDKKQLGFSMKASHFQDDPDSDDDSDGSMDEELLEDADVNQSPEPESSDADMDSEDENYVSKAASKINKANQSENDEDSSATGSEASNASSSSSSAKDSQSEEGGSDSEEEERPITRKRMDTDVGFEWGGANVLRKDAVKSLATADESESSDDESDEEEGDRKTSHKSRKKHAQRQREEQEIMRRETALADGTADNNPETAADFERLLAGNPDSSELWIKYMAFHLSTANVSAAKEVAERSFGRISFRQEGERLNAWCALLTLELKYGSDEALQRTIDRACQSNNPKHVHLRVCEMLGKEAAASSDAVGALQRADDMYAKLCKKFKSKKKAWLAHIEHLLKSDRSDEALALSKKALLSLPEYKHRETMAKVAQLVFEHGNPEQARTLFDGLLARYPKRLDLFSVFVDKEVKHGSVSAARVLFERQASTSNHDRRPKLKLTDKQMKGFFKKWYAFETQHGDASLRERVKDAARAYVEQSS